MAATLAGADGAVLSHRSAAALWRMRDTTRRAEVTVVRHRGPRPGVQFHQAVLKSDEIAVVEGIPVTTPARTLLDLATVLTDQHLEAAFQEAEVRRLTSPTSLDALLERYPGRRGTAVLRRILEHHRKIAHPIPTSVLERRFLALLDAHGLPRPNINRRSQEGRDRRHLARPSPHRRVRRLRHPPPAPSIRGSRREGPPARRRRLARHPPHRAPAQRRRRHDRPPARRPPERLASRRWSPPTPTTSAACSGRPNCSRRARSTRPASSTRPRSRRSRTAPSAT